jgi:hypothetical protein
MHVEHVRNTGFVVPCTGPKWLVALTCSGAGSTSSVGNTWVTKRCDSLKHAETR